MTLMGTCSRCGARCMAASGSVGGGPRSRGSAIAAVAVTGRRLGYVVESLDPQTRETNQRLVCRECVVAAQGSTRVSGEGDT